MIGVHFNPKLQHLKSHDLSYSKDIFEKSQYNEVQQAENSSLCRFSLGQNYATLCLYNYVS